MTALRETSIIFAAIGATFLNERMARSRYLAAGVVMAGAVAIL